MEVLTAPDIKGYVAYKRSGKTLIALYGPVCRPEDAPSLVAAFADHARRLRCRTAYFGADGVMAAILEGQEYDKFRAARDSVIDLKDFTIKGNRMMNVRRGYNHARNVGLQWSEYDPREGRDHDLEGECQRISLEWLKEKGGLEIDFILGRLDWDVPGDRRFFTARSEGRVEGILVYHPAYNLDGWYLDLSRRRTSSPNGTMDFLTVQTIRKFRKEGSRRLYMGMIPDLTFPEGLNGAGPVVKGVVKALSKRAEFFYPVRTETFYKNKYQPTWNDLYLCIRGEMTLGILYDMLKAFQPGGIMGMLGRKMKG
jgi:phosphatidylglycerol lysyltransferase